MLDTHDEINAMTSSYHTWIQETDPAEFTATEALERWSYRTGPYGAGEFLAIVARYGQTPETRSLTVFQCEDGPIVERVPTDSLEDGKESAEDTIAEFR